jgi:hypothetical protein
MAISHHEIAEVDCRIERIEAACVLEKLGVSDAERAKRLAARIELFAGECVNALRPRGVYRLFNPAICTLPPAYTEPAIKLVGTFMVLKGQDIYVRMSKAVQCVIAVTTLGAEDAQGTLRKRLCQNREDEVLIDACFAAIADRASEMLNVAAVAAEMDASHHADGLTRLYGRDFSAESLSSIAFYLQTARRLGVTAKGTLLAPSHSVVSLLGFYDKAKRSRRACARCRFRKTCSIRAVGMNCHGRKGQFVLSTANEQEANGRGKGAR